MKRIKPIFLLLLLFVCFLIPMSVCTASAETVTKEEPKVYITETGTLYHNYNCTYLNNKRIAAVGLYQAKDAGYTACSRCGGKSSGTINVKYEVEEEEDDNFLIVFAVLATLLGVYDIYLICLVVKHLELDWFLDHFKRLRTWVLLPVACAITFIAGFLWLQIGDATLNLATPLGCTFITEIAVWVWIQTLFSDG